MNTITLNKTNLRTNVDFHEIEKSLGIEINQVYNRKPSLNGYYIYPGVVYPTLNKSFKPFSMVNKDYKFDHETGILTVIGRDKWERGLRTIKFQLERVGYKLRTTSQPEGFIWGFSDTTKFPKPVI